MSRLSEVFEVKGSIEKKLFKINLLFVLIFLNIWDLVVNRTFFNAMAIGAIMFAPSTFLWFVGNLRAVVLLTLISLLEFFVMLVFVLQGFELSGTATTLKSAFFLPYFAMSGVNAFIGLKLYTQFKEKLLKVN